MRPGLSVVLPLFRTRASVPEVVERLHAALATEGPLELVFVDDGCPERSWEVALEQADVARPGVAITVLVHDRNHGQHAAVMTGLSAAVGPLVAAMDADLQDAPEHVAVLVDVLLRDACSSAGRAVAAGRRGRYQGGGRRATARLFRRSIWAMSRGRVPADASTFLVMDDAARRRILELDDPRVHLVAALARTGATIRSVPIERSPRKSGRSSYASMARVAAALRALVVLTPAYPWIRRQRRRSRPDARRLTPSPSLGHR